MLDEKTISNIIKQFPKVLKVINYNNISSLMVHYGRRKAIEITLNNLDLFDIVFKTAIGTCYYSDKRKDKISSK